MAIGVNIAKANLAVTSGPLASVMMSKSNLAVQSHVPGRVVVSKTNFALESNDSIPLANRRRSLILG